MGEFLLACGWTVEEAVQAVVDWDLYTLAAAIANEQAGRGFKLSPVPAQKIAKFAKLVHCGKKASAKDLSKKHAQVARSTIRINLRPPSKR